MADLAGLASEQFGFPADVCFDFFFLPLSYCVNIASKDFGVLSILSLVSKIAVFVGIGLAGYFLISRKHRETNAHSQSA